MSIQTDFRTAESHAKNAEDTIGSKTERNAALQATINAAELYMRALRLADTPTERKRLDKKCKELLNKAEEFKKARANDSILSRKASADHTKNPSTVTEDMKQPISLRKLTAREQIIILQSSKLNGFVFKPWENAPSADEFELADGDSLYEDKPFLALSPLQVPSFVGWERPVDAFARIEVRQNGELLPSQPTMVPKGRIDLVQDMTSDCSVVASLCAGTSRAERGHRKILRAIVYPYDHENDRIMLSRSGRYVLRLYFNGCWRRVDIDDTLPASSNSRILHVVDRTQPGLLWPALVEKAYLKVRGGYDFPGSNSGTDLAVLTGWIPQQVFLHDEDIEPDDLWAKIYSAFMDGDLLLTMGTGKLPEREQRLLGLAAEHDYAVLDMKERGDTREILAKNPWSDGDVWTGATKRRPNQSPLLSPNENTSSEASRSDDVDQMPPGTFWMDFGSVFQYFENLYVNWNPGLFSRRQDLHFAWSLAATDQVPGLFISNPQFSVSSSAAGEVWLLLNKHFRTGDYSRSTQDHNGYISLYVYDRGGKKIISSDGAKIRGPYVDSPNTLLCLELRKNTVYTVVVASQDLLPEKYTFTMSVFSNAAINLQEASDQHGQETTLAAAWTTSTAGGNSDSPFYLTNPQFSLRMENENDLAFVLKIANSEEDNQSDIHVKILVFSSDGRRITRVRPRDIVANSGDYRRGSAVIETRLPRGNYTIICSTFDPDQHSKFTLALYTSSIQSAVLRSLPAEGSGRLSIMSDLAQFPYDINRLLAPVTLPRNTKAIFKARSVKNLKGPTSTPTSSSLFKMTLEHGQGPYKNLVATSAFADAEFSNLKNGVRIEDIDLQPSMLAAGNDGLWLVLERLAQRLSAPTDWDLLQVEILADEHLQIGPWGLGDG